jgi:hypothetical protein
MVKVWNQVWTNLRVFKTLIIPLFKKYCNCYKMCLSMINIWISNRIMWRHFWHPWTLLLTFTEICELFKHHWLIAKFSWSS